MRLFKQNVVEIKRGRGERGTIKIREKKLSFSIQLL